MATIYDTRTMTSVLDVGYDGSDRIVSYEINGKTYVAIEGYGATSGAGTNLAVYEIVYDPITGVPQVGPLVSSVNVTLDNGETANAFFTSSGTGPEIVTTSTGDTFAIVNTNGGILTYNIDPGTGSWTLANSFDETLAQDGYEGLDTFTNSSGDTFVVVNSLYAKDAAGYGHGEMKTYQLLPDGSLSPVDSAEYGAAGTQAYALGNVEVIDVNGQHYAVWGQSGAGAITSSGSIKIVKLNEDGTIDTNAAGDVNVLASQPVTVSNGAAGMLNGLDTLVTDDGRVFTVWSQVNDNNAGAQTYVYEFNPATNTWSLETSFAGQFFAPELTQLADGTILVGGAQYLNESTTFFGFTPSSTISATSTASLYYKGTGGGTGNYSSTDGAWVTGPDGKSYYVTLGGTGSLVNANGHVNTINIGTVGFDIPGPPCFTKGTRIKTQRGEIAVENLVVGDKVLTLDHGYQDIRWIGSRKVAAIGKFAPIEFAKNILGNDRPLRVSQQHRMLLNGPAVELYTGEHEVLVAAKHLVNGSSIRVVQGGEVDYFHLLFDQHEIVFADGAASESFHPGTVGLNALDEPTRQEIYEIFPELAASDFRSYGQTCRTCLSRKEGMIVAFDLFGKAVAGKPSLLGAA